MALNAEQVDFYRRYALEKLQSGRQSANELRKRALDDRSMLDVVEAGARLALREWDEKVNPKGAAHD